VISTREGAAFPHCGHRRSGRGGGHIDLVIFQFFHTLRAFAHGGRHSRGEIVARPRGVANFFHTFGAFPHCGHRRSGRGAATLISSLYLSS
jgi:hypothetical protein